MRHWTEAAEHHLDNKKLMKYRGGVQVKITAVFKRPANHYKRKIRGNDERLTMKAPRGHFQKPDCDNISKFVGDCLSGLAFYDDCQISSLRVDKRWSHTRSYTKVQIVYLNRQLYNTVVF